MNRGKFPRCYVVIGSVLSALATATVAWAAEPALSDSEPAALARKILDISGVQGGVIVQFGCGDGKLTAALRAGDSYLVHGLALDAASADAARRHIQSLGLYGNVSVEVHSGRGLPYADNLVNLLVAEDLHGLSMDEVLRVLTPGGAACLLRDGKWTATIKPRPESIDQWTHALHDASNNSVSHDTVVGPPEHLQWMAGPQNTRHHEAVASVTVVVSAGGRLFYIVDEAPVASIMLPPQWHLAARDACNGVLLWKRPLATWEPHLRGKSSGPPELSRRLVASGDRVYAALGLGAPVTALDAATGKTLITYEGTEATEEILYCDGTLYLVTGAPTSEQGQRAMPSLEKGEGRAAGRGLLIDSRAAAPPLKNVMALHAASGRLLWKRTKLKPLPMSLAVGNHRAFWLAPDAVVCADRQTGADVWRAKRDVAATRPAFSAPTLVVQGDVVLCADRRAKAGPDIDESTGKRVAAYLAQASQNGDLVAYSVQDGRPLWSAQCCEAYCAPTDVFVNDGLVWLGQSRSRHGPDFTAGFDLQTGEVERRMSPDKAFESTMGHHRCYRNCATSRYLLTGRTGVEFIDLATGDALRHHWIRGVCQYGVVPANGLLYVPPHSCACYIEAKLTGLLALAPGKGSGVEGQGSGDEADAVSRLEKGPAYVSPPPSALRLPPASDWPTYRHDPARSGRASTTVSPNLKSAWQARPGGRLSSPVIADGRVLVSSIDAHTVYAFDADGGKLLWQYTAGGRIDSPPTMAEGLCVFGCADGWVYCLSAADGQLAWRYRVAPAERRVVAMGQLESAWPTQGSVLARDGAVYCAAGRSSYIEGGIRLYRLDLKTGKVLAQQCVYSPDPRTGEQPGEPLSYEMPGALPDILSGDSKLIYMRHLAYEARDLAPQKAPAHLYSPAGFLNDEWSHRTYWIYGEHFYSGYIGWYFAGREVPAGRLLSIDDATIYGFGYKPQFYHGSRQPQYHLFAIDRTATPPQPPANYMRANRDYPQKAPGKFLMPLRWSQDVPQLTRAMLLAGGTVFLAGPPVEALDSTAVFNGSQGARLCAVSATDGKTLSQFELDSLPVLDGMAAAQGRLYLTLQDGRLLCFGDSRSTPGG